MNNVVMATKVSKTKSSTRFCAPKKSTTPARKTVQIESEESESSDSTLSDDENHWNDTKPAASDLTPDYQNIQKLVKYVKAGNTTATMISLCCLKDYDLTLPMNRRVRTF